MSENIKISIVMPVYKVEQYVGKAIESILSQTLREWEFLIVDDGSPDQSGWICDTYAQQDNRIRVIHKENGGAASARNAVIPMARGEYMYFMDADDWAEPTMLEEMYALAQKHQAQLVITGFYIDTYYNDKDYRRDDYLIEDAVYMDSYTFRKAAYRLFDKNLLYTPWNKLYQSAYILQHGLLFPDTLWDDFPFNLSVVKQVERVVVSSKQYYHFIRKREESETVTYRPNMYEKREEEHGWMVNLYKTWEIQDENSQEMISRRYVERLIGCVENLTNPKCSLTYREKRSRVKNMLEQPHGRLALKLAKPRSVYMKLLLIPLKWKNVTLTLMECQIITYVKTRNTKLFSLLKVRR